MVDGMSIGGFNPMAGIPEIKVVSTNRCYVIDCPVPIIATTPNGGHRPKELHHLPQRTVGGTLQYRHRFHGGTSGSMKRDYGYIIDLYEACNFIERQLLDDTKNYVYWKQAKQELQCILRRVG